MLRFSFKTSVVAAGAVAEEIEPSTKPKEIAQAKFFVTKKVIVVTTTETTRKGTIDSKRRMPVNCFPYFFITEVFNSAPIKKPIRERATPLIGSKAAIVFGVKI